MHAAAAWAATCVPRLTNTVPVALLLVISNVYLATNSKRQAAQAAAPQNQCQYMPEGQRRWPWPLLAFSRK
jgi:hypothetical protein